MSSYESIIKHTLDDTINNQDFTQRVYMAMNVSLELYRMIVSTLLILFVPQNCYGHLCSFKENLIWQDNLYDTSLTFNFITLCAFILLYSVEIVRENRMISYLEVNTENPRDNKSITKILENLPMVYQKEIYSIDYIYRNTSYACILVFIINTILSGVVIYKYNYGNQTTTTFITNVLFMTTKVYSTYYVANTEKSIFYSAYLHDRVQYNDIDSKIKVDIEKGFFNAKTPTHYVNLRDPSELLTHEIMSIEDATKELYTRSSDSNDENIYLSLGFPLELPLELPIQQTTIELEMSNYQDRTFIDLPNEVDPEDPNKEVVDLIRHSVKEVLTEMREKMEKI